MSDNVPEKICSTCKESKSLDHFHKRTASPDGRQANCIDCKRHQSRLNNWKTAGLDIDHDDYASLSIQQGGKCAICGRAPDGRRLAVDHDHKSGDVRALLCLDCNTGLGKFRDDPELLETAIAYLRKHGK